MTPSKTFLNINGKISRTPAEPRFGWELKRRQRKKLKKRMVLMSNQLLGTKLSEEENLYMKKCFYLFRKRGCNLMLLMRPLGGFFRLPSSFSVNYNNLFSFLYYLDSWVPILVAAYFCVYSQLHTQATEVYEKLEEIDCLWNFKNPINNSKIIYCR